MIVQLGLPILKEVNFDPGLNRVAMTVFNSSGVQIGSPIPMTNPVDTLYLASYTPPTTGNFILRCVVYTDTTYATPDPNYARSSESYMVLDIPTLVGSLMTNNSILGYADTTLDVYGLVDNPLDVIGIVQC